jgi:DNA-binding transcriptional ArsR family regulator
MTMTSDHGPAEPEIAPPSDADLELALLAKALGHPARVHILGLLLARDTCCCGELVDQLPLAQATVSQHLKVLKEAGLVQGEIEGPRVSYCANRERLRRLGALVRELEAAAVPILEQIA